MFANTAIRRRRTVRSAGFTLVEILAVVVILGIASAVIIPQIGTRDDMRTAAAARTLVADLIYAQNYAITSGTMTYVKFDTANKRYSLLSTANSGGDVYVQHPITQANYVTQFGSSVKGFETVAINSASFTGSDAANYSNLSTLAFDELGAPYVFNYASNTTNDMSTGSIVLKAGTFTTTITVSAATGEISVN
jgi:prepilin-type N-terminal cleavage/methylation domain-containing protein